MVNGEWWMENGDSWVVTNWVSEFWSWWNLCYSCIDWWDVLNLADIERTIEPALRSVPALRPSAHAPSLSVTSAHRSAPAHPVVGPLRSAPLPLTRLLAHSATLRFPLVCSDYIAYYKRLCHYMINTNTEVNKQKTAQLKVDSKCLT